MNDKPTEAEILQRAAEIQKRAAEHEDPAAWKTAVELQERGWSFSDFPDGVTEEPKAYQSRTGYTARLGVHVSHSGTTMKELAALCVAWEANQARLKPEARSRFIPDVHPLAASKSESIKGAGGLRAPAPAGVDPSEPVEVFHRLGSEEARRRGHEAERRIISFQSGVAEVVEGHGDAMKESNHASQFGA